MKINTVYSIVDTGRKGGFGGEFRVLGICALRARLVSIRAPLITTIGRKAVAQSNTLTLYCIHGQILDTTSDSEYSVSHNTNLDACGFELLAFVG